MVAGGWAEAKEEEAREQRDGRRHGPERGTVHALPEILEEPLVFLSVDTPRREPTDVIFVDPAGGMPVSFIRARDATGG